MSVEVKLRLLLVVTLAYAPLLKGGTDVISQTQEVSTGEIQILPSGSTSVQENPNTTFEQMPGDLLKLPQAGIRFSEPEEKTDHVHDLNPIIPEVNSSRNNQSLIWSGLQNLSNNSQSHLRYQELNSLQSNFKSLSSKQPSSPSIRKEPDAPEKLTANTTEPKPNFHSNLNVSLFVDKQLSRQSSPPSSPDQKPSNVMSNMRFQSWESKPTNQSELVQLNTQNEGLQPRAVPHDARNQQLNQHVKPWKYEHNSLRDQLFELRKSSSQIQQNITPSSQTDQQNIWEKSLNEEELPRRILSQNVPMTTKSQATRERRQFQTSDPQTGGSKVPEKLSYEATQNPPRFITVPPLGKDHVVSGKVFFSHQQSQTGGLSRSLSQKKPQEPSTKPTKQSQNFVLPSGLEPRSRPLSEEHLPQNSAISISSQQNVPHNVQTSFSQSQSSFEIHQNEPKEVDFGQLNGQLGQNKTLSKLEPQLQPQKSQNYQAFNPLPEPLQENSEILPSRSEMRYADPKFDFNSYQQWHNSFPSSPEESWSLESSNSQENLLQNLPSSQTSAQLSRRQPGNPNLHLNYKQESQLSKLQQPSLFNLKPDDLQNNPNTSPSRLDLNLQPSRNVVPAKPHVSYHQPVGFSQRESPSSSPLPPFDQDKFQTPQSYSRPQKQPGNYFLRSVQNFDEPNENIYKPKLNKFQSQSNHQFAPIPNPQIPSADSLSGLQWLGSPGAPPPQTDNMDSEHFGMSQKVVGLNPYLNFDNPRGLYVQKTFQSSPLLTLPFYSQSWFDSPQTLKPSQRFPQRSQIPHTRSQAYQNQFQNLNPGYRFYQNSLRPLQTHNYPDASLQKTSRLGPFSRQNQYFQKQGASLRPPSPLRSPASVHFSWPQTRTLPPKRPWNQNTRIGSILHKPRVYEKPRKYHTLLLQPRTDRISQMSSPGPKRVRSRDQNQIPSYWDWTWP